MNVTSPCIPACRLSPQLYFIPLVSSGVFPIDEGETIHFKSQLCSSDIERWMLKSKWTATVRKFKRCATDKMHRYKNTQAGIFQQSEQPALYNESMNFCRLSPRCVLFTRLSYLINSYQLHIQKWAVLPPITNCKWSYYRAREVIMMALCLSHQATRKTCYVYDGKCCMTVRALYYACPSGEAPADCSYASL